jgi:E3 ubiquitin-protein ligase DOA10
MGLGMHRLIKRSSLPTEEKERLSEILERTLRRLDLVDRNDALTESIARMIIDLDRSGVRDPEEIAGRVLKAFGLDEERATKPRQTRSRPGSTDGDREVT